MSQPMPQEPDRLRAEIEEQAALFVLGQLPARSASALRALMDAGCTELSRLVDETRIVLEVVAASQPSRVPPPAVRDRLLAEVSNVPSSRAYVTVNPEELAWEPAGPPGVFKKVLYRESSAALTSMLIRMDPGTVIPAHSHARAEQCLILDGDVQYDGRSYKQGDFLVGLPEHELPELSSLGGNLLFIVGSPHPGRRPFPRP